MTINGNIEHIHLSTTFSIHTQNSMIISSCFAHFGFNPWPQVDDYSIHRIPGSMVTNAVCAMCIVHTLPEIIVEQLTERLLKSLLQPANGLSVELNLCFESDTVLKWMFKQNQSQENWSLNREWNRWIDVVASNTNCIENRERCEFCFLVRETWVSRIYLINDAYRIRIPFTSLHIEKLTVWLYYMLL